MKVLHNLELAYFKEIGDKSYAICPALGKRRLAGKGHPEEAVRMAAYNELQSMYGYPVDQIDIEVPVLIREDEQPRFADIVVFDDKEKRRPFIVVEAKEPKKNIGEKQGQRYATILRAVYSVWTNGRDRSCSALVNRYPEEAVAIKDVPSFGGLPVHTITRLAPFLDDKEITTVFRRCHNAIWSLSNLKPDAAFTEFLKLLLVKLEDEGREADYSFQVLLRGTPPAQESTNETAQRVRLLFKNAVDQESEYSAVLKGNSEVGLTNDCIAQIVAVLQKNSFSDTSVDLKGRAFETFLSGDLRQEFKEFMTPKPVVRALVEMANPSVSDSILDPCCGSGSFLIESLRYVREAIEARSGSQTRKIKAVFDFAHDHLYGFDDSEQMAAVARINMLINEDGRAHIFKFDALTPKNMGPFITQEKTFDLILTNPPFGKRITQPNELLKSFQITRDENDRFKKASYLTETLFLERDLQWLKPGKDLFIVLPDSVLGNSTLHGERAYIERIARLKAVISLPSDTFGPSGAKTKTSVVILQKRGVQEDTLDLEDEVFIASLRHVGYDFTGRSSRRDDLPQLVEDYKAWSAGVMVLSSNSKVVTRRVLGATWLAQSHFNAAAVDIKAKTLDDLCSSIRTGKTAARGAYQTEGLHVIKVGNLTGSGLAWNSVERQYVEPSFADRYPKAVLRTGDILFTAAAHGPKWIGLKVDMFEGVPSGIAEPVVCCAEVMICTPREGVDSYDLLLFLRSNAGYEAIQKCIRGQSGHIYSAEVKTIQVPRLKGRR